MDALVAGPVTALAKQVGFWECDLGNSSSPSWVEFHWPLSSLLEQAFCQGKSSVEFIRGGNQYQVVFEADLATRHKEAMAASPSNASQVNVKTNARRTVRRFCSQAGKAEYLQREVERQMRCWSNWIGVPYTWLLEPPLAPKQDFPSRRSYSLGDDARLGPHFPEPLRSWPSESTRAVHPRGDPCNFALERLTADACCEQGVEWSILNQIWQSRGSPSRLLAAFRVQNRGLMASFVAQEKAMRQRLAQGADFSDGRTREPSLGVQLLWHGTKTQEGLLDICRDGFDRAHANSCLYGKGCYFATTGSYSDKYACQVRLPGTDGSRNVRAMLLAAVLVGECVVGSSNMYPPPRKSHSISGERYENACDRLPNPSIYVTFKDNQALPAYVMLYEP